MTRFPYRTSRREPLDFNAPRRTDTVADALGPDPSASASTSGIDAGALLTEAGLPDHAVRSILAVSSVTDV